MQYREHGGRDTVGEVFKGFGRDTVTYLDALTGNNTKAWFDHHRKAYDARYLAPALAFIAALQEPLAKMVPTIAVEPRVNGSLFRINRDTRFSKDKTPYKNHIDFWFWLGERKALVAALFMRLTSKTLILGAGSHGFEKEQLERYRAAVVDPIAGPVLERAAASVEGAGHQVLGEHYKTIPRGCTATTPMQVRFLKHNGLYGCNEGPHPRVLGSPAFVDHAVDTWRSMLPIFNWLVALR